MEVSSPDLPVPIFYEFGIILEFCLEILETTAQDKDLMRDILTLRLENITCLRIDLTTMSLRHGTD